MPINYSGCFQEDNKKICLIAQKRLYLSIFVHWSEPLHITSSVGFSWSSNTRMLTACVWWQFLHDWISMLAFATK